MSVSIEEKQNLKQINEVLELLGEGQFIKAMTEYLDDGI